MRYYTNSLVMLLLVALVFTTCGSKPKLSHGGPVLDYVSLLDSLRAGGASVEPAGEIEQPFFSVTGRVIKVNGGDVDVFEYDDSDDADAEAKKVSPDGRWVGKIHVNWVATPHFYKRGKLLVIYVGDTSNVLEVLETAVGPQFAGR